MTDTARPRADPASFAPGDWVRHPGRPDWGVGQVQSAIGSRVTVNFEHAGKVALDTTVVVLLTAEHDGAF